MSASKLSHPHQNAARVSGLAAALAYAATSTVMALLNKALLSSYAFKGYFTLLLIQLTISIIFCYATREWLGNPLGITKVETNHLRQAIPMAVAYVSNVAVGLFGLQSVNLPVFFALRRLCPAFIMVFEYYSAGKAPSTQHRRAVLMMAFGALLAAWDTFDSNALGYAITLVNNVITAASYALQKGYSASTGLSTWDLMYANSLCATPIVVVLLILTGEPARVAEFPALWQPGFIAGVLTASSMGILLTYTSVQCTLLTSPLTTSVTGNAKDLVTTSVGWLLFGNFAATGKALLGLAMSFTGAALYSVAGLSASRQSRAGAGAAASGLPPSTTDVGAPTSSYAEAGKGGSPHHSIVGRVGPPGRLFKISMPNSLLTSGIRVDSARIESARDSIAAFGPLPSLGFVVGSSKATVLPYAHGKESPRVSTPQSVGGDLAN